MKTLEEEDEEAYLENIQDFNVKCELADVCCIGMEICEKVKKKPELEEDWVIDPF